MYTQRCSHTHTHTGTHTRTESHMLSPAVLSSLVPGDVLMGLFESLSDVISFSWWSNRAFKWCRVWVFTKFGICLGFSNWLSNFSICFIGANLKKAWKKSGLANHEPAIQVNCHLRIYVFKSQLRLLRLRSFYVKLRHHNSDTTWKSGKSYRNESTLNPTHKSFKWLELLSWRDRRVSSSDPH